MVSIRKILVGLFVVPALLLSSCGGGNGAAKGYSLRKTETAEYYKSIGGTGKEVTYNSAAYVKVVRENSRDTYFYKANYTISSSTLSKNFVEYFAWVDGDSSTTDSSDTAYNLA